MQKKAEEMLKHLKSVVFLQLASLANDESSFGEYMRGAECKINKPSLLVEAVNLIDKMEISQQNQYLRQGDTSMLLSASLNEYLLSHLSLAGCTSSPSVASGNGQFRTPQQEEYAGVVATEGSVESLRGRNSAFEPREAGRQVEGFFESLLAQSFGDAQ